MMAASCRRSCGIPEQLEDQRRPAVVARHLRHHRRDVAARRVAGDRDPGRIAAQFGGVFADPPQCGPCVVEALRVGVLGGQSVVHRHHDGFSPDGVGAGHSVVGVEIADRPAAAMVEDHHREVVMLGNRGPVDTDWNVGQVAVADGSLFDPHGGQGFWRHQALSRFLAGHFDTVLDREPEWKSVEHRLQGGVDARPRRRGISHESTVGIGRLKRNRVEYLLQDGVDGRHLLRNADGYTVGPADVRSVAGRRGGAWGLRGFPHRDGAAITPPAPSPPDSSRCSRR